MMVSKARATHCLHCGEKFERPARRDRIYCGESCRVLAYGKRRQQQELESGILSPRSAARRRPLLHSTMAALADLQAQIIHIGHSLQEEERTARTLEDSVTAVHGEKEDERESLRQQLAEVTERLLSSQSQVTALQTQLGSAQQRVAELEGIVSAQTDRIHSLEVGAARQQSAPASGIQRAVQVIAQELTRDEARWLTDLSAALQSGYDPQRDLLVERKCEEIATEQDIADAEERAGRPPSIHFHRGGMLLFPMAIWAARMARQEAGSQKASGVLSRSILRFGEKLPLSEEEFLCKLSAAQKRDLGRKLQLMQRR